MPVSVKKEVITAGFFLIFLGLVFNEKVVIALFSPDGIIEPSARGIIWVFDIVFCLAGLTILIFRKRISSISPPNFPAMREGGHALEIVLAFGIAFRILVYGFLFPENNDPHLEVIEFITNRHELPASNLLLMAFHPPLYYLLAALWDMIGSPKFIQLFSLLLSIGNIYLLYRLIKITPLLHDPQARMHTLLFVALLPQFVIFGNFISNDSLAFLLGTFTIILSVNFIEQPTRKNLVFLSISLGAGLLTKGSFFAYVPLLFLVVVLAGLGQKFALKQHLPGLLLFGCITLACGSYKFIENSVFLGTPFPRMSELEHGYIERQKGTYQGLQSILDVNLLKLLRHPFWSEHTTHSIPLLMYGTFWYPYIPESNFLATRYFPLNVLPRAIILMGLLPTFLILTGTGNNLLRKGQLKGLLGENDGTIKTRMQEIVITWSLISSFALVLVWGLRFDAWSFFQGRLLFPCMISIAILFGWGYETWVRVRPTLRPGLNFALFSVYSILSLYLIAEVGSQII